MLCYKYVVRGFVILRKKLPFKSRNLVLHNSVKWKFKHSGPPFLSRCSISCCLLSSRQVRFSRLGSRPRRTMHLSNSSMKRVCRIQSNFSKGFGFTGNTYACKTRPLGLGCPTILTHLCCHSGPSNRLKASTSYTQYLPCTVKTAEFRRICLLPR